MSTSAGTGTGCKAGFLVYLASSGVRAGWCWCGMWDGGYCGVSARNSNNSVGNANWNGALGGPSVVDCMSANFRERNVLNNPQLI